MGFNLGQFLPALGNILGSSSIPGAQTVGSIASLSSQFFPQPVANIGMQPVAQRMPVPSPLPMPRAGGMIGRGFFNRFPNLATVIQAWRNRGVNVKRSQLWSMLKRWGPEILVSGGILTAAAVSELMVAGPGHRRMNAANAKALRRAARRIKSFHRLCRSTDLLSPGKRGGGRRRGGSVAVLCPSCRKSPCRC